LRTGMLMNFSPRIMMRFSFAMSFVEQELSEQGRTENTAACLRVAISQSLLYQQ